MSLAEIEHQIDALSLAELQELKFHVEKKIDGVGLGRGLDSTLAIGGRAQW